MIVERGDVLRENHEFYERWWKGLGTFVLTSTKPVPYWFLLTQDQNNSLTQE